MKWRGLRGSCPAALYLEGLRGSQTSHFLRIGRRGAGCGDRGAEGDVYEPSGTLSGGAAPTSSGILVKV